MRLITSVQLRRLSSMNLAAVCAAGVKSCAARRVHDHSGSSCAAQLCRCCMFQGLVNYSGEHNAIVVTQYLRPLAVQKPAHRSHDGWPCTLYCTMVCSAAQHDCCFPAQAAAVLAVNLDDGIDMAALCRCMGQLNNALCRVVVLY